MKNIRYVCLPEIWFCNMAPTFHICMKFVTTQETTSLTSNYCALPTLPDVDFLSYSPFVA